MQKERFAYIDALRGYAIFGVIVTHVAGLINLSGGLNAMAGLGSMGVQLFFVISAFTIFYSLSRSEDNPNQVRDFFIKRLFRIVPVYWLGILMYSSIYGLNSRGWLAGPELWHIPVHFFLLNNLHPETSSSVVPGGWSISCEVLFYMMVPLLYSYVNNRKKLLIFIGVAITVLPALNVLLARILDPLIFGSIDARIRSIFWYRFPLSQIACFSFGMGLFFIQKNKKRLEIIENKSLNLFFTGLVLIMMAGLVFYKISWPLKHHVFSFLAALLALLLSVHPWRIIVNNIMVFLGKISYSCYLLHFLVLNQLHIFLQLHFPEATTRPVFYFFILTLLCTFITAPLAYLSYRFIEQQATVAGRKLIEMLNRRGKLKMDLE